MGTKISKWDASDYINNKDDVIAHLNAAFEDGDSTVINEMIGYVARSHGMTELSRETGLNRESLYKALSASGNPEFSTAIKVLNAMGLQLQVADVA